MRILAILSAFLGIFLGRSYSPPMLKVSAAAPELALSAASHILIDSDSGEVIYEHEADVRHFPASMTKMMGMLLVLESIDRGELTFDTVVTGSEEASSMGGTQIFLAPGEQMQLEDLFKAVAINSANDAIVALGEKVAGSHQAFVEKMNHRAAELEMTGTHFANATGFDDPDHYVTARDMAKCARQLLTHQEDILRFSRLKESYIRTDSDNPFWLVNTNKLLGHYEGLDGLKTGYTNLAGYNLTATAIRGGVRLISVTMQAATIKERSRDTVTLMDYGFSQLKKIPLYQADTVLATYDFRNAKRKAIRLYPAGEVGPIYDKNVELDELSTYIELTVTSAPIACGTVVGHLVVKGPGELKKRYDVVVKEEVESMDYLDFFKDTLLDFMF